MNLTSLARPYAQAAFELALTDHALAAWGQFLNDAALIASNPQVVKLISKSLLNQNQLENLFLDVLNHELDIEKKNLIRLLVEYNRLLLLPQIAIQFKKQADEAEKQLEVEVESATELSAEQKDKLAKALTKRFKLNVTMKTRVNAELLGGALIRAGDVVIDGSLRGKLNRLVDYIS